MSESLPEPTEAEILTADHRDEDEVKKAVPAWIISIVVHAVVLGVLATMVVLVQPEKDDPAIAISHLPEPEPEQIKPPEPRVEPKEVTIEVLPESDEVSPISELEVEVTEFSREEDNPVTDTPQGLENAIADSAMSTMPALAMAIGVSGDAASMWGGRTPGGKKRALAQGKGGPRTERLVDGALRWFARHQSPNGQWDIDGYPANCDEAPKCEPGTQHTGMDGDVAATGYALLCFLGSGYDHRTPSRFKPVVKQGLDWLVSVQKADGSYGRNYEHAVAAMALAEAYGMTADPALRDPAQRAVDILIERQIRDAEGYPLGWDYVKHDTRNDGSVTGWCAMAIKSAAAAGLEVKDSFAGVERYLEGAWKATNAKTTNLDPYTDTTTFPYTWNQVTNEVKVNPGGASHDLAPVGMVIAVFTGRLAGDPMLETLANHVEKHQLPKAYPLNTYYLYYNTLGMFQTSEARWERWNNAFVPVLEAAQRDDGCFAGSWDAAGTVFHGHQTGRLLSTAYNCLSLEVYYRYAAMRGKKR